MLEDMISEFQYLQNIKTGGPMAREASDTKMRLQRLLGSIRNRLNILGPRTVQNSRECSNITASNIKSLLITIPRDSLPDEIKAFLTDSYWDIPC